jgi:hypothetical protein
MITKIDNPKTAESKNYSNKGSAARLKNYLIGNEEKIDKKDLFFNFNNENISGKILQDTIDNNVKGLGKDDNKFFSISVNPSTDELAWIGCDKRKFKEFIKETMRNYSKNFKGINVNEKDIVWGAIIHEKRFYTELDEYKFRKREGEKAILPFKRGDPKPGNQMHAHIIVSARDVEMKKTFNVLTASNKISRKFDLKGFQRANQNSFQEMFYYKNGINIYVETQKTVANRKIEQLERLGYQPQDLKYINRVGEGMNFNGQFTRNLNRLVQECYKGNVIVDTEKFLELGDKKYRDQFPEGIREGAFEIPNQNKAEQKEEWNELFLAIGELEHGARQMKNDTAPGEQNSKRRRKRKRPNL